MNASDFLSAYRNAGSDEAFSGLVRRYTNLVFSVAKRKLGDSTLAEDATQTVFTRLARVLPRVNSEGELVAWLHRTTVHVAIDLWRSETRRRNREQQAAAMQSIPNDDTRIWEELAPHLDQALDELDDSDRQAVLLRFYEHKPMREVGEAFGISEDAAKMRISRAIERLRGKLSLRGITCPVLALTALLLQNSVEAAPAHLFATLNSIKLAGSAAAGTGAAGWLMFLARSKTLLGTGAAVVAIATVVSVVSSRNAGEQRAVASNEVEDSAPVSETQIVERKDVHRSAAPPLPAPAQVAFAFLFRVIDRATGAGLPGVKVQVAYFYAGGVGEGHDVETDSDGNARIPHANKPNRNRGANIFVSLPGYVPKSVSVDTTTLSEPYVLELDAAFSMGGVVIDEDNQPVPNVELEALRQEESQHKKPNTDFQLTKVTTDADGRWFFPYVPTHYQSIKFYLACTNYAVTEVEVPVNRQDLLNARVVIKRGFTVAGRVTNSQGQPVAGAKVREFHEFGYRKLSATTEEDGTFVLIGLSNPIEPSTKLVVEAKGFAGQLRTVELSAPTKIVDFVLHPGHIFRGHVVDEGGNPIPGTCIRTDMNFAAQIPAYFAWRTYTDAAGRFEWDSAPENEEVCFWFEVDGYEVIRGEPLATDGTEHEIRLKRK